MRKHDCIYFNPIVESIRRQTGDDSFDIEELLVDEVCTCEEKGGPLHYHEYDCEKCPYYQKVFGSIKKEEK